MVLDSGARGVLAPIIDKLDRNKRLSDEQLTALAATTSHVDTFRAKQVLIHEGDRSMRCVALLDGHTCTFKSTREGRRQITAFHVPGDMPDLQHLHHRVNDAGISSLTACTVAFIPHRVILDLCTRYPDIAFVLWRETLTESSIYRQWVTNLGQRDAESRIAHVVCEFLVRMEAAGLASDLSCRFPIVQHELADATGMSAVHVNRSLQELRARGIISLQNKMLKVLDWPSLTALADFDPTYLHLNPAA